MFKTLKDFSVVDKRVLVRCDFNVPLDEKGNIKEDFKIRQTLPTIKYLMDNKAKIILMSHLGEPGGKVVPELKMDKVAEKLSDLLNVSIAKEDQCVGPEVETQTNALKPKQILLLENLRFYKEESENSQDFAKKLSFLGDIYVNDAFGVCHRNNASVTSVSQILPGCAGLLLQDEIEDLEKSIKSPERPMVAIIGGKKVETKAKLIDRLSQIADCVIVSGLIAKEIADKKITIKNPEKIVAPSGQLDAPDINDESIKMFSEKIMQAKTILWNGPFGRFEFEEFSRGTFAIADAVIKSGAFSVVGGGETVEFLNKKDIIQKFSHVSTGGGAMLTFLSGDELPGLTAIGYEGLRNIFPAGSLEKSNI